ncbi:MAG: AAA family ATPase, partial [Nanoarchaeota archaeon]|nr:AAA family ATPase [Nanoarchaeota archaeon]
AVYSLLKDSHPMQNPELIWRSLREVARASVRREDEAGAEDKVNEEIQKCLLAVLTLSVDSSDTNKKDEVSLENNGIYIDSVWGKQELSALGDGYRGLTTMIMDIISWQLLMKNNEVILKELYSNEAGEWVPLGPIKYCTGIVIIDEIEKHLHPRLQRLVIEKLNDVFPKIQFIISSHSPLCVAGTADVEDKYMIYRTLTENGNNCVERWTGGLSGLRTDQILEHFFQVPYLNESTLVDMETYSRLYLMGEKGRQGEDKKTFLEVTERLKKSSQSTFLELESKLLDKIIKKQSKKIEKMIEDDND